MEEVVLVGSQGPRISGRGVHNSPLRQYKQIYCGNQLSPVFGLEGRQQNCSQGGGMMEMMMWLFLCFMVLCANLGVGLLVASNIFLCSQLSILRKYISHLSSQCFLGVILT